MRWVIRRVVTVQQVQRHATNLHLPGTQPDGVPGQGDLPPQPFTVRLAQGRDGQLSRVVVREESLLRSVLVDYLAKVALLVEEPHADDWNAQIAGGLELIAGDVAQAAGVDGQSFAQHEFHAEVRNAAQRGLRMGLLKPRGRLRRISTDPYQIVNVCPEGGL